MGTGYEPKFPPSETDFHHLHHHHGGYGGMNGITTNHMDYSYHNHNGYNYANYTPTPTTPFYHHHPPYGSPQMHPHTNAPSPNITPQSNSSYVANAISNNNSNVVGNRNSSTTIPTATSTSSVAAVNGLNVSENSSNVDNSLGYYNSYYGTTNGHHDPQDLPLQCPSTEPPANTALGLHELGIKIFFIMCCEVVKKNFIV